MYTELLRIRREHRVLTDPTAQQHVSIVGDTVFVVRSVPDATASLVFNFCGDSVDHPAPDPADAVVFDSEDPRWRSEGPDTSDPATIASVVAPACRSPEPPPPLRAPHVCVTNSGGTGHRNLNTNGCWPPGHR